MQIFAKEWVEYPFNPIALASTLSLRNHFSAQCERNLKVPPFCLGFANGLCAFLVKGAKKQIFVWRHLPQKFCMHQWRSYMSGCDSTRSHQYAWAPIRPMPWDGSPSQATSGQPAILALPWSPLRRLTLSVLFLIGTTSYQTTCTSPQDFQ